MVYHELKQGFNETCFQTYKIDTQVNSCNSKRLNQDKTILLQTFLFFSLQTNLKGIKGI